MSSDSDKLDADFVRKNTGYRQPKGVRYGGRKKGTPNKRTLEKLAEIESEGRIVRAGKKVLAVDDMDKMIEFLRNLVAMLVPWGADGRPIEGRDTDLWFRALDSFQTFLQMRAPYQSPRLNAIAVVPPATQQRTMVSVTILNDRGEKVYSDADAHGEPGDGAKLIEHEDGEAA